MNNVVDLKNSNSILAGIATAEETVQDSKVPAGYVPVQLSTKGKLGAPKKFHIRNFNTKDLMGLALTEDHRLPSRILHLLQDMIFEKDVNMYDFHESEVVETMVRVYGAFYSTKLMDVPFTTTDEDYAWMSENYSKEKFEEMKKDIEEGHYKPVTDIDLETLSYYELSKDFSPIATIKNNKTNFQVGFRIPKFGDAVIVKTWIHEQFGKKDEKFANIERKMQLKNDLMSRYDRTKDASLLEHVPFISQEEEEEYQEYTIEKSRALVDVIRALHLVTFDGKDVSKLTLAERAELVQDPRVDVNMARKLDAHFEGVKIGIKPEVTMMNPFTRQPCARRFLFRLTTLLQAIQFHENDGYDIIVGEANVS